MHLYPVNGAAHRVGPNDTAWSYRDAEWGQVIVGVDPDPASKDKMIKWARDYHDAMHPYGAGGAYALWSDGRAMEEWTADPRPAFQCAIEHIHAVLRGDETPRHLASSDSFGNARTLDLVAAAAR